MYNYNYLKVLLCLHFIIWTTATATAAMLGTLLFFLLFLFHFFHFLFHLLFLILKFFCLSFQLLLFRLQILITMVNENVSGIKKWWAVNKRTNMRICMVGWKARAIRTSFQISICYYRWLNEFILRTMYA